MLATALRKKTAHQILQADSGEACLEILNTVKVDLILLDILMPEQNGDELLARIRQSENSVDLPIMMVTSKTDPADIMACLKAGADDYLTKPVHFGVAISRIETQLRLRDLSAEMTRMQEREALDALIMTYNHEINNPLSIALASIAIARRKQTAPDLDQLESALRRIAEMVRQIQTVTEQKTIRYENYSAKPQMIAFRKKTG